MELQDIFASEKVHEYAGRKIKIKQISLEDIPLVLDIFSKVMGKGNTQEKIMTLIRADFDKVKEVLYKFTDIPKDEVGRIHIGTAVFVIQKIVEDNASFLQEAVVPMVKDMAKSFNGLSKSKS